MGLGLLVISNPAAAGSGGPSFTPGRLEPIKRNPGRCPEASGCAPCAQRSTAARLKRIPAETAVKQTFGSSTGRRADSRQKLAVRNLQKDSTRHRRLVLSR